MLDILNNDISNECSVEVHKHNCKDVFKKINDNGIHLSTTIKPEHLEGVIESYKEVDPKSTFKIFSCAKSSIK